MRTKRANHRIRLLLALLVLVFGATMARAAWLQVVSAGTLSARAKSQHHEIVKM